MILVSYISSFYGYTVCTIILDSRPGSIPVRYIVPMSDSSPEKMKGIAKQIFPSLFLKYADLTEEVIVQCLIDCKFNEGTVINTLNRKVKLYGSIYVIERRIIKKTIFYN